MFQVNIRRKKQIDLWLGSLLLFALRPLVRLAGIALRRDHDPEPTGNFYFIKMQGGGSLVLAFSALLALKERHPDFCLILVTTPAVAPFARAISVFDQVLVVDDSSIGKLLLSSSRILLENFAKVDQFIDLEVYSRLTTVFTVLSLARNRIGFYLESTFWREYVYTHLVFFNRYSGSYLFYERIAKIFDAVPASIENCREHLVKNLPDSPLDSHGELIAISCCCSEFGQERMLTTTQWQKLLSDRLPPETSAYFVLLGSKIDRAFCDQVIENIRQSFPNATFLNKCGELTLAESIATIQQAKKFFGIDSGLLHFSRLLGIPSVSCWGPTDPQTRLKPVAGLEEEIIYRKIPCSPCIHSAESPPCRGNNVCIKELFDPLEAARDFVPIWLPPKHKR